MSTIKTDITTKSIYSMIDVTLFFLFAGAITFLIGFTGCVGALRENTALLAAYAIFLAILLLLEMTAGILGFIFKDWVIYNFNSLYLQCSFSSFNIPLKEALITSQIRYIFKLLKILRFMLFYSFS